MKDIQKKLNISDDKLAYIVIATTEAVINAIQHGNKLDPQKQVFLKVENINEFLLVSVEDEGEGFDPTTLSDPRDADNILKERGRGIFIIRNLADKVEIETSSAGTIINMFFKIL